MPCRLYSFASCNALSGRFDMQANNSKQCTIHILDAYVADIHCKSAKVQKCYNLYVFIIQVGWVMSSSSVWASSFTTYNWEDQCY